MEIIVTRYNPMSEDKAHKETYDIPLKTDDTALAALNYIYEHIDSTLSYRYGCRFKRCGLCAIKINGKARLACKTRVEDGMLLEPLDRFPVVRDLVINRRPVSEIVTQNKLYLVYNDKENPSEVFKIPPSFKKLASCTECLACLSECPNFSLKNGSSGGPLLFLKLAQLHYDPRDTLDRIAQAKALGLSACLDCKTKCRCVINVPIYRDAIKPFLEI